MRINRPQYINQPPSIPDFIFKMSLLPYQELVNWAEKEYKSWLAYLAEGAHYKELKWFLDNVSPYRILAEMTGFRRYVSLLRHNREWAYADKKLERFIVKSFQLRDHLFRDVDKHLL